MNDVIQLDNVSKSFGSTRALEGLSTTIQRNRVVGLLGLNGAGKTTTMKLLCGLLKADSGTVRLFGEDPWRFESGQRRRIGFLSEDEFPFEEMTFTDAAQFTSRFYPSWDEEYLADLVDLLDVPPDQTYSSLSRGQQRKFYLALVLAPRPELVLLDDPASGLDVTVRREFMQSLLPLMDEQESTILFSSHVMSDVERVAEEVVIIHEGRERLHRSLDDLKEHVQEVMVSGDSVRPPDDALGGEQADGEVSFLLDEPDEDVLEAYRNDGHDVRIRSLSLEDLFVKLVEDDSARSDVS